VPEPPRVSLIQAPTPLHRLERASEKLGLDLWIKRDDLTGFAFGGNKGRKLEYLIADALAQGADSVVSCGSIQSNFIRQLGAACACYGLKCGAAVMHLPFSEGIGKPAAPGLTPNNGNVTLDHIVGVDLRVHPDGSWEHLYEMTDVLRAEYEAKGHRVCSIPIGGSSWLGAYAFEQAGKELTTQTEEPFDWIVFASSSGSTQCGLARAFHGTSTKVQGIACDPEPEMVDDFADLAVSLQSHMGGPEIKASDFLFHRDHVGPGYGVPSEEGNQAIEFLARAEGIFLDPIYTGKAFAALMSLAKEGKLPGRVLFWHTGGTPTLFARE
jgi:D-cysteine desulfhydrase family pyridoxal phosphate-dependent enzyme